MTTESEKLRLALYRMSPSRRALLETYAGGRDATYADVKNLSRFLTSLCDVVASNQKVELRGLGVFEWKPWENVLPTGRRFKSWRLLFKFNQRRKFCGASKAN